MVTYIGAGLAFALTVAMLPVYLAAALVAPSWLVSLLLLVWIGLFCLAALWLRSHPLRVLAIPVILAAVWLGVLGAGGAFGGGSS